MATKQFLTGVQTVYINGVLVPTTEEVTYSFPTELKRYAESNQGPLGGVLNWSKEPGSLQITYLHYAGLNYVAMFDEDYYEVSILFRSGDLLTLNNAILAEKPSQTAIAGQTEVQFSCLDMEMTLSD